MAIAFAYLAQGRLHLKTGGAPPRLVESAFAEQVKQRAREIHARQSWKTEGRGARFMSGGLLWGLPSADPALMRIMVTGLTRGTRANEIVCVLDAGGLTGVCAHDWTSGVERRLLHGSEQRLEQPAGSAEHGLIACSVKHRDGTSAIAVMQNDASELTEVTEGDVLDQAPSWVPGPGRKLVYQSAGIGRNREGQLRGAGPFTVHQVDLDRGETTELVSDQRSDLLGPRMAPDGILYFIRRPHLERRGFLLGRALIGTLLFPFRLLFAFFQYLNFFSARYTGKPLTTGGGPKREGADLRQMMIWGNLIDGERAARENAEGDEPGGVVPRSWKLVRRLADGSSEVVAEGVVSFDLCGDGSLVYSTGSAVYRLPAGRKAERLLAAFGIEQVIALE